MLEVTRDDPYLKKELQEAVDEAVEASARADAELPPMYFDQLSSAQPQPRPESQPSLPASLDLSGTLFANQQEREQLEKTLFRFRPADIFVPNFAGDKPCLDFAVTHTLQPKILQRASVCGGEIAA
jgi:hypothetical protein